MLTDMPLTVAFLDALPAGSILIQHPNAGSVIETEWHKMRNGRWTSDGGTRRSALWFTNPESGRFTVYATAVHGTQPSLRQAVQNLADHWGEHPAAVTGEALRDLLRAFPAPAGEIAARVGGRGPCNQRVPHAGHFDSTGVVDNGGNLVLNERPGQHAQCANCDDRRCMSCVFREVHDRCVHDCGECAPDRVDVA